MRKCRFGFALCALFFSLSLYAQGNSAPDDIAERLDYVDDFSHGCDLAYIERLEKDMAAFYAADAYEFSITHNRKGSIYYDAREYRKAAAEFMEAVREAMEKQMRAERERREKILIAEGQKQSEILVAEGKKQSAILEAEAEKQSMILRAEAEKEAAVRRAEGEATAIREVQQATADGLKMIKEAGVDEAVLKLRSLETMEKAADGQATKLIIPAEFQSLAGVVSAVGEIARAK